ncbi:hypothetical protein D9M72_192050 [compost metagenome]
MASWLTGGDHRQALLVTGSYFVVGLGLLCGVNTVRGRRAALRAERKVGLETGYGAAAGPACH